MGDDKAVQAVVAEAWVDALALDELPEGEARVVTHQHRQIAVFRLEADELHAIDNRCPHHGNPLAQGQIQGCTVTCAWHGHKFDLSTGKCLRGDGDVEIYPVRVRDGRVELALAEPNREAELERRAKSLKENLQGGRLGHVARDVTRLLSTGVDPARIALEVAAFDAQHNERGVGQALPVACDALRIAGRGGVHEALLPLLNAADIAADASRFRAPRRVPASQDPGRDPEGMLQRLAALCDAQDAEGADGLMRGALWRKWGREVVEPWFYELCASHFLGSGSGLTFTVKAFDLLEATGFEHARRILPGLTYALASMTRDDQLPEWQWFRQRYSVLEPRLGELWARLGKRALGDNERRTLVRALLDGSPDEAWHAVIGALASGVQVDSLIDALSRASAERLWRFDPAFDADPSVAEGWLDVTRCFTHVHALREASRRHSKPTLLRMLLFAVRHINRTKPLDLPAERWLIVDSKGRASFMDRDRLIEDLHLLIRERQPVEAQRAALAYLSGGGSIDTLRAALETLVMRDLYTRPVMTAHAIQLVVVASDEAMLLPDAERTWPLRAVIRMLASPVRERSVEALALDAQRLLFEGQTRPRLT